MMHPPPQLQLYTTPTLLGQALAACAARGAWGAAVSLLDAHGSADPRVRSAMVVRALERCNKPDQVRLK